MAAEHGAILVDGIQIGSTRKCVHCGGHFQMLRGSGVTRGWCMRCGGVTCGSARCDACIPEEARLDHAEGQRNSYSGVILDQFGVPVGGGMV
ncbi:MAG TPA: hypothetical protein VN841_29230 [Bryobacteraceae bacterium]|nr:hypothetical protein [Bryobacteraceae bacterium]